MTSPESIFFFFFFDRDYGNGRYSVSRDGKRNVLYPSPNRIRLLFINPCLFPVCKQRKISTLVYVVSDLLRSRSQERQDRDVISVGIHLFDQCLTRVSYPKRPRSSFARLFTQRWRGRTSIENCWVVRGKETERKRRRS